MPLMSEREEYALKPSAQTREVSAQVLARRTDWLVQILHFSLPWEVYMAPVAPRVAETTASATACSIAWQGYWQQQAQSSLKTIILCKNSSFEKYYMMMMMMMMIMMMMMMRIINLCIATIKRNLNINYYIVSTKLIIYTLLRYIIQIFIFI